MANELGLEEQSLREQLKGVGDTQLHSEIQDRLTESISEEMLKHYDRLVLSSSNMPITPENIYYNVAPVSFVILAMVNLVYQFFNGQPSGLDYLISALVMLIVICFIQQTIADKKFTRLSWDFLAALQERTSENIQDLMKEAVGGPIRKYIERIQKAINRLDELKGEAQKGTDELTTPAFLKSSSEKKAPESAPKEVEKAEAVAEKPAPVAEKPAPVAEEEIEVIEGEELEVIEGEDFEILDESDILTEEEELAEEASSKAKKKEGSDK